MGIVTELVDVSRPGADTANVGKTHGAAAGLAEETHPSKSAKLERLGSRIDELNQKCTQVLLFLSFAVVSVALSAQSPLLKDANLLDKALLKWTMAMFPTVLGILPLKDFFEDRLRWYSFFRWFKVVLLWIAVLCIFWGAIDFIRSF